MEPSAGVCGRLGPRRREAQAALNKLTGARVEETAALLAGLLAGGVEGEPTADPGELAKALVRCGCHFLPDAYAEVAAGVAAKGGGAAWEAKLGAALLAAAAAAHARGEGGRGGAVRFGEALARALPSAAATAVETVGAGDRQLLSLLAAIGPVVAAAGGAAPALDALAVALEQVSCVEEGDEGAGACGTCGTCSARAAAARGWAADPGLGARGWDESHAAGSLTGDAMEGALPAMRARAGSQPWRQQERSLTLAGEVVVLRQMPDAKGPTESTGLLVWRNASLLLSWQLEQLGREQGLRGRRVLDLGCGLGVNAITCALLGAHAVATDGDPEVVRLAQENSSRALRASPRASAGGELGSVTARHLPWGEPKPCDVDIYEAAPPYDLIIGSDIMVFTRAHPALRRTLQLALAGSPGARCFLSHSFRQEKQEREFLGGLADRHIVYRDVTPPGQERGTHLFELERAAGFFSAAAA